MSRLDDYRTAMLAANTDVSAETLIRHLDESGSEFASFIVDHGLGPLWHSRTGRDEFHESRLSAEAHFLAQENALDNIDTVLDRAGIEFAVIKGAANRQFLYENPALRTCYDIDLLVRPQDRLRAASCLVEAGFTAIPEAQSISRELVLTRGMVDVDLHWGLLREGRLRADPTAGMLNRRQRHGDLWTLNAEDALFVLLVHPAFAKHLAGWEMGLHRLVDIVEWLRTQSFDWPAVRENLQRNGVKTAAWGTLRWVQLLTSQRSSADLNSMILELAPGPLRRAWLNRWLEMDLSARTSNVHWLRLLGFSLFLHDTPRDSVRAISGMLGARQRVAADLAMFENLSGQ